MATGVAYDDWSRCCVSSSPIHIYICEDESDTGDEQAREMRNKVMKLMVVNDKPENFFQVFTLTARIHAQVEEDLMKKHLTVLKEGEAVSVNTFQLKDYLGEFRTNPYPYKITFFRTTKVKAADDFLEYYPIKTKGKDNSKLDIILRDTMNVHLTCTFWSDFAKKVMDYTKENNTTIVICVIKFACIKEYKGNISISNAFNSTQIFLNPETAEVKTFTAMLSGDNQLVTHSDSKVSFGSAVSLHDEMLVINPRKTISGILDSRSVGTCVVVAKIDYVDLSKKWYYVACDAKRKFNHMEMILMMRMIVFNTNLDTTAQNTMTSKIYFLILRVSDESASITKFLLFDETANKLIARPALELVEEAAESPIVKFSDHEWEAAEEFSRTPSSKRREETSCLMSVEDQGSSTKKQKMMQVKVEQRKDAGVAYILGKSYAKAKQSSSVLKKLAVNVMFAFMNTNCRGTDVVVNLPHTSLLQIGMVYYV
ncbi:uncharacterized protein LOC103854407 [Brassica rapa]|uniref:uncharacterized protein LOC103854407 n=1 Tax=Brassica campestris TaxID=3711 RepID=UPI00142DB333|nr:uncharacterized protein LOC103854407 [Brassica rapa]